jgi:multiple sugar transport system permease protein
MMNRIKPGKILVYGILIMVSIVSPIPHLWLIRSSFMSSEEIFAMPLRWMPERRSGLRTFKKH